MIQFNLLPDVKIAYIKSQRTKRLVILASLITTGVCLAISSILAISVLIVQDRQLSKVTEDIKSEQSKLDKVEDLNKILTIQNQLNSLPNLHDNKPVTSRLLGYVAQLTPADTGTTYARVSKLNADFAAFTMSITGTADSLATVNKYADSIKFATYKTEKVTDGKPFKDVVTTSMRITESGTNISVTSYQINLVFDPVLFSNVDLPALAIPKIISTRSETEKPVLIFKEDPKPSPTQGAR